MAQTSKLLLYSLSRSIWKNQTKEGRGNEDCIFNKTSLIHHILVYRANLFFSIRVEATRKRQVKTFTIDELYSCAVTSSVVWLLMNWNNMGFFSEIQLKRLMPSRLLHSFTHTHVNGNYLYCCYAITSRKLLTWPLSSCNDIVIA